MLDCFCVLGGGSFPDSSGSVFLSHCPLSPYIYSSRVFSFPFPLPRALMSPCLTSFTWCGSIRTLPRAFLLTLSNTRHSQSIKLGIHLRQRRAKAQHSSLSSASVNGATNRAICFRDCRNPSHQLSVDQSEASPRNFPPYAQYGWNMLHVAKTENHSLVRGTAH